MKAQDVISADTITRQEKLLADDYSAWEIKYFVGENEIAKTRGYPDGSVIETGKIPEGTVKVFYNDKSLMKELAFSKGKLNGRSVYYYDNGIIKREMFYLNGKLHGSVKEYYYDGILMFEEKWFNGRKHGWRKTYGEKGELLVEEQYAHGEKTGMVRVYNKTEKISAEVNIKK